MARIELELEDVFDFIDDATKYDLNEIRSKLNIKVDELNDEIEDLEGTLKDTKKEVRDLEDELENTEGWEIKTLYDEMKLKLLKSAMKVYSLEELECKLGKEFDLSVGIKPILIKMKLNKD